MATQVVSYKCPACTAPLHFVGESGRLECEFCDSSYSVEEIEAIYGEKNERAELNRSSEDPDAGYDALWGEDGAHMRAYSCPSCGAELICDDTTAATSCPYCGNPSIVPGQFTGTKRPDYVIPFKLSKEDAVTALKQHCKGKPLLPKAFRDEQHIREIKGIYVPFWLFDGEADTDVRFAATRSSRMRRGDDEIITTQHFTLHRAGTVNFRSIPADGAAKMPDTYMDSIEPYDYRELKPFALAYLPGYLADQYDVEADTCFDRVCDRIRSSAYDAMRETVGFYETCIPVRSDAQVKRGNTHSALMPVWLLNTKYKGRDYLFAMNGQTGKMVGELPMSWGRFWAWFAGIAAGSAAALTALMTLMML